MKVDLRTDLWMYIVGWRLYPVSNSISMNLLKLLSHSIRKDLCIFDCIFTPLALKGCFAKLRGFRLKSRLSVILPVEAGRFRSPYPANDLLHVSEFSWTSSKPLLDLATSMVELRLDELARLWIPAD